MAERTPVRGRVKALGREKFQVCVTFEEAEPPVGTEAAAGAVGVDQNSDHLACVETNADGRLLRAWRVRLEKGEASMYQAVRAVVGHGARAGKPVIAEHLDFRAKKGWLKRLGKRFAEVLSGFRSKAFAEALERRARREGVELRTVDPAYTTQLGKAKYQQRLRMSRHHAAALVIARRATQCAERLAPRVRSSRRITVEMRRTTGPPESFRQWLPRTPRGGRSSRTGARSDKGAPARASPGVRPLGNGGEHHPACRCAGATEASPS